MSDPQPTKFVGPKFRPDDGDRVWHRIRGITLVAIGLIGLSFGLSWFFSGRPANPSYVAGTVSWTAEHWICGRCVWGYLDEEIKLVGNPAIYDLTEKDFPLQTPHELAPGSALTLSVDKGTTTVLALWEGGRSFVSPSYTDPNHQRDQVRLQGAGIMAGGLVCFLLGLALMAGWQLSDDTSQR